MYMYAQYSLCLLVYIQSLDLASFLEAQLDTVDSI